MVNPKHLFIFTSGKQGGVSIKTRLGRLWPLCICVHRCAFRRERGMGPDSPGGKASIQQTPSCAISAHLLLFPARRKQIHRVWDQTWAPFGGKAGPNPLLCWRQNATSSRQWAALQESTAGEFTWTRDTVGHLAPDTRGLCEGHKHPHLCPAECTKKFGA